MKNDPSLKLLNAAGVEYSVIDHAGAKHGSLEVLPKKNGKGRHYNHPPGTFKRHHEAITSALKAGEPVFVPYGPFSSADDRESLRSSISANCSRMWGNGNYITACNATGIELLRVE